LIANTVNNRYAIANNQGLAVATGKYILYVNSDVQLLGNAIKDLYQFLETHAKAGVVGAHWFILTAGIRIPVSDFHLR